MLKTIGSLLCVIAISSTARAFTIVGQDTEANGCIGVAIEAMQGIFVVQKDLPGSPAEAVGMAAGDVIEAVKSSPDGALNPVAGKTLEEVVQMIRGPVGTQVVVDVVRAGKTVEFTMTREEIHQQ